MHSHLLPGLDDGLKTLDEAILFINELYKLGYRKLICTPHVISDMYPNNPESILSKNPSATRMAAITRFLNSKANDGSLWDILTANKFSVMTVKNR